MRRPFNERGLYERLRDTMAYPLPTEQRLDKIVALVARYMVSDHCSIWMRRASGDFECHAEVPEPQGSRGTVVIGAGKGILGLAVARADAIWTSDTSSAVQSSGFVPVSRDYNSELAVPISRGRDILGALVVEDRQHRDYSKDEVETLKAAGTIIAELLVADEMPRRAERPKQGARRKPSKRRESAARTAIPALEPSRSQLIQVKELLDGCVGAEAAPATVGNRIQLPLSTDVIETVKSALDAGIRTHESPIVTRRHVTILASIRSLLIEYNKTLEVLNGSVAKTTKLVFGVSKLVGVVAVPTLAFTTQLSSAVASAIGSLGAAIAACRTVLGL
jgi:signal transduction protein with GAF and PtsI domain